MAEKTYQGPEHVQPRHLVFIANPFSGTHKKENLPNLITKYLNQTIYSWSIEFTEYPGHATEIAAIAAGSNAFAVIAAGGDGTVNEVAAGIIGTNTALGILPYGSGNGFAYHIGIERSIEKAFMLINGGQINHIDTAEANGKLFLNVAGLGLDATVAYKTKKNTRRGFFPYFIQTLKESVGFSYLDLSIHCTEGYTSPEKSSLIQTPHQQWEGTYAMAVVANGSVYGYGFAIAPKARLDDGMLDVLLVKKAPVFKYFFLAARMLNRSFHKSPLVEYFRTPQISIALSKPGFMHVDGEGYQAEGAIHFQIRKNSLQILSNG